MLVHFPTALYPFGFVMDCLGYFLKDPAFFLAGCYSLFAALLMSLPALVYGAADFLHLKADHHVWKKAFNHGLLNTVWFMVFLLLAFLRYKSPVSSVTWIYMIVAGSCTSGLFFSNYIGADLVIRHGVGVNNESGTSTDSPLS